MVHNARSRIYIPRGIIDTELHIVGVGATGSAQLDLFLNANWDTSQIFVYDGDEVAIENTQNQVYDERHVGMNKAEAIAQIYEEKGYGKINVIPEFVTLDRDPVFSGIVVFAVDSFSVRGLLVNLVQNQKVDIVLDTRTGEQEYESYWFNPKSFEHVEKYLSTLGDDSNAPPSLCGTVQSVKYAAYVAAGVSASMLFELLRDIYGLNKAPMQVPNVVSGVICTGMTRTSFF